MLVVTAGCGSSGDGEASPSPEPVTASSLITASVATTSPVATTSAVATTPQTGASPTAAPVPSDPPVTAPTVGPPADGSAVTEDSLARFVAATEAAIAGTVDAGLVEDRPEIYIAVAQVGCARLSAGESFAVIADEIVVELDGSDGGERLVGAVLGAATRTICPEHADKIQPR